jgi:hypothetical protein
MRRYLLPWLCGVLQWPSEHSANAQHTELRAGRAAHERNGDRWVSWRHELQRRRQEKSEHQLWWVALQLSV